MSVVVYSQNGCMPCKRVKDKLSELNVDYVEKNVSLDQDALVEVLELGYQATPVVYVDESNHWHGFDLERMKELAVE